MRTPAACLVGITVLTGCYSGELSSSLITLEDNELAGVAGPPDRDALQPVERIPRSQFGADTTAESLTFPSLDSATRSRLFNPVEAGSVIRLFMDRRSSDDGLGPLFNQHSCVGCHDSGATHRALSESTDIGELITAESPMGRARRTAASDLTAAADDTSDTSAYIVFGDYHVGESRFDGLEAYGGPIHQRSATDACTPDLIPNDLHAGDSRVSRQVVERAAPSYVGRGLIEAVYEGDIEALADPTDARTSSSTLAPAPSCEGDCISGRAVLNHAAAAFEGGDPVLRVGRFGHRGARVTLLDLVAEGAHRGVGLTHPFTSTEEQNAFNSGFPCDKSPDPELTADQVLGLRDLVRNLAPPEMAPEIIDDSVDTGLAVDVATGAALFGVDLETFRSRLVDGSAPVRLGDEDADHGIAEDRQLNCVGCHTPIMVTGRSPSKAGAAQLSNRWVPLFSDLLVHDMGGLPLASPADEALLESSHPYFRGIPRSLADYALPEQRSGVLLDGTEWRTAPLLAFGKVGPPYLHDARVFLNPLAPAYFFYGSRTADEMGMGLEARRTEITDAATAIRAAIELHDLPQPPDFDRDGTPDYDSCPELPAHLDWCSRNSPFRSEARNSIEKWHHLTDAEQAQVVAFLLSL